MIVVELSSIEYSMCVQVAQRRFSKKQDAITWIDNVHKTATPSIMANVAELCFSKITGIDADFSEYYGGDGGIDFRGKKETLQLKTASIKKTKAPNLLVRKGYVKADIFVLSEWHPSRPKKAHFVGFMSRSDLVKNECPFCVTPSFIGWRRNLTPIEQLKYLINLNEKYEARIRRELGEAYKNGIQEAQNNV